MNEKYLITRQLKKQKIHFQKPLKDGNFNPGEVQTAGRICSGLADNLHGYKVLKS